MAGTQQIAKVSCRGGLDLRANFQELLSKPGFASVLDNFESEHQGGYRRINGYASFGTTAVPGSGTIKGIKIFNDTILVARGDDLWHTFDTVTWVQINKVVAGADHATIEAASATALTSSATFVDILPYSHGTAAEDQIVTIVNGFDNVMIFTVNGTSHTNATYSFEFLNPGTTGAPDKAAFGYVFKDQVYLSGTPEKPSSTFLSTLFDPKTYNGTNSLEISTANRVIELHPFRDKMIIFCQDEIDSLEGANSGNAILTAITTDVGCVVRGTVQEVSGDLVFLSQDGLRNLAGTARIDDTELSTISSPIQPVLQSLVNTSQLYNISSVVLREKSQYRLYYPRKVPTASPDRGIIGTLVFNEQGQLGWGWSQTKGISASVITEGLWDNEFVSLMAVGTDGVLYQHDVGNDFDGETIKATYQTPFADLGDPSIRKNIHRVRTYIKPTGPADIKLSLKYSGFGNELSHDPAVYSLGDLRTPAIYGEAVYGDPLYKYDSRVIETKTINTEGSGFLVSLIYMSTGSDPQYNIQGYDLDLKASGKV